MRHVKEGAGRYDNLHGDEPGIEAERAQRQRSKDEYDADHWNDLEDLGVEDEH